MSGTQIVFGAGLLIFGLGLFFVAATISPPLSLLLTLAGALAILGAIGCLGDRR